MPICINFILEKLSRDCSVYLNIHFVTQMIVTKIKKIIQNVKLEVSSIIC